jgi:hypothetical protein
VCTRSFHDGATFPADAVYQEELYGQAVATPRGASGTRISTVVAVLVVALLAGNYFVFGYGPDWAHRADTATPGDNWKTYRGFEGATVALPGSPVVDATDSVIGNIDRARVGVNGHWDAVLDASTSSSAARAKGRADLYATVAVGRGTAPTDVGAAAASVIRALAPGIDVGNTVVTAVPTTGGALHDVFDVVGHYTPSDGGAAGTIRGRVVVSGTWLFAFATDSADPDATVLQRFLVGGFSVAPAGSAAGH